MRKLFVVGSVVIGWLGLMAAWSLPRVQSAPPPTREGAEQRPLDTETTVVRLLLGVGDPEPRSWNGRVTVDKGEIVGIDPWRFRARRRVTGPDAWESRSLYLLKTAQAKAKSPPRRRWRRRAWPRRRRSGSGQGFARRPRHRPARSIVPTGVLVRLKAPADATLNVATEHGNAAIKLADLAGGAPRRYLDGQLEARRVPTSAPLRRGPARARLPRGGRRRQGGRLGRLRRAPAPRARGHGVAARAAQELRVVRPRRRAATRSSCSTSTARSPGASARRDRPGPRRLAPVGRRRRPTARSSSPGPSSATATGTCSRGRYDPGRQSGPSRSG